MKLFMAKMIPWSEMPGETLAELLAKRDVVQLAGELMGSGSILIKPKSRSEKMAKLDEILLELKAKTKPFEDELLNSIMRMFKKTQKLRDEKAPASKFKKIYTRMEKLARSLDTDQDHHPWAFIDLLRGYISVLLPEGTHLSVLIPGRFHPLPYVFDRYQYGGFHLRRIHGDEKLVAEWVVTVKEMFIALFEAVSDDPKPKVEDQSPM